MKLPSFKLWSLCLAVAAIALMIKLALMVGSARDVLMLFVPLVFIGPRSGVALQRYQGGTGVSGGIIAGFLTGFTLSSTLLYNLVLAGHPFAWDEAIVFITVFTSTLTILGWAYGRFWRWPLANRAATKSRGAGRLAGNDLDG